MKYQISRFILLVPTLLLGGCTDLMVNNAVPMGHQGYYTQHHYVEARPVRRGHSNQYNHAQATQYNTQATQYNNYYEAPEQNVYFNQPAQRAPRRAPAAQQHAPMYHQAAPAHNHNGRNANAEQAQIASDRAMAQRLQNEEYARAHRQAEQIASDRAMAERLQAEEYAR